LRREFRDKCKEKEERNRKRIEEEIKSITAEAQIWKFVNLGRKKPRIVEENISVEEWEKHFLELLEEEKGTDEGTREEKRRMEGDQEEELREEEIEIQLKKIKRKKAIGIDDIGKEAWLYSNGRIKERLKDLLKRIRKGENTGFRFPGRMEERSDNTNTQKRRHKQCKTLQRNNTAMHGE